MKSIRLHTRKQPYAKDLSFDAHEVTFIDNDVRVVFTMDSFNSAESLLKILKTHVEGSYKA